jgi:DNA-binding NtrC family response regulator
LESKNFRLDLYHRLSIVLIHVPSLNNRRGDIPLLTDFFLQQIADEYAQETKSIDIKALETLKQHNWTGNIRELRNVIERLVIFSNTTINSEDIKNYVLHQ